MSVGATRIAFAIERSSSVAEPIIPNLCEKIAAFYDEEIFNSFNLVQDDVLKIKCYKHLLKRIEQDSIDAMVNSNRAEV